MRSTGSGTPRWSGCSRRRQDALPNLQLSTVYRSVETLTAHGLVSHTHLTGATPTYQLATHGDHAHLVCRGCGSVTEMDDDVAHRFTADIARVHGFDVDFGHLSVFGRCASCVAGDLRDDQAEQAGTDAPGQSPEAPGGAGTAHQL